MTLIKRTFLRARPQELGKIKIGGKGQLRNKGKANEFRLPVKYDHFVVTTRVRGEGDNFVPDQAIHAKVGDEPRELRGVLMFPTVEENFHSEMCQYKGRSKKAITCDGESALNLLDGEEFPCPSAQGADCPKIGNNGNGCKPYARLHLQLWDSPHTGGYHVFRTTSWESANNIQTALEEIYTLFGTLYQAPVKLMMYPAEDTYEEGGQSKVSTSWKVGVVLAMTRQEAGEAMIEAKRQLEVTRSQLRIAAGEVIEDLAARDVEEAQDIGDEWFPPEGGQAAAGTQDTLETLKEELGVGEGGEAPVVEADVEEGGGDDVPEPEPIPNAETAERASDGMIEQLGGLRDKARERDVPGLFELEGTVDAALEDGGVGAVKGAIADLTIAMMGQSKAEAAQPSLAGMED